MIMKTFENILIASDIDGTILWEHQFIHPRNLEKLRYFCDHGGRFTLSTGRNHIDIFRVTKDLEAYVNAPCILCNGSYLYDKEKNEIINPKYLDHVRAVQLFTDVKDQFEGVGFRASFPNGFLCAEENPIILEQLRAWGLEKLATVRPLAAFSEEKLFKAAFVCDDADKLARLQTYIAENYSDSFSVTTSGKTITEVQPLGVSKKTQIMHLKQLYPNRTLWCIGDFNNDLEMLKGADVAVCPANAVDAVKEIAHIEVCHCKDGALADMIDEIEKSIA